MLKIRETTKTTPRHIRFFAIVKNESKVIERCLNSVIPHIDSWCIVDTGSTDGTQGLIAELMDGIPGELHEREWANFAANRTEALQLATADAEADILLTLDADWELRGSPELVFDALRVPIHSGDEVSALCLVLNARVDWEYQGAVHEHVWPTGKTFADVTVGDSRNAHVVNHSDGGSRDGRLEADIAALEQALADDPDDSRSAFYLANTYLRAGRNDDAREAFMRRIRMAGFKQEVYVSLINVASLVSETAPILAHGMLLRACSLVPDRFEAPAYLATNLMHLDAPDMAWGLLKARRAGVDMPRSPDAIMLRTESHETGMAIAMLQAAKYSGHQADCDEMAEQLLAHPKTPDGIRTLAEQLRTQPRLITGQPYRRPKARA